MTNDPAEPSSECAHEWIAGLAEWWMMQPDAEYPSYRDSEYPMNWCSKCGALSLNGRTPAQVADPSAATSKKPA